MLFTGTGADEIINCNMIEDKLYKLKWIIKTDYQRQYKW